MEPNTNFSYRLAMNTEAERRKFAAMIMASMMQNAKWGDKYSHIASMAVSATAAHAGITKRKNFGI